MRVDLCGLSVQYHGSCSLHRVPIQKRVHAIISKGGGGGVRGESGLKAGLILRVVWVVGGPTGDAAGPQALKADARAGPPTLYGQYMRVPEGVALPHVLPVQGLGAAPSAVPRGGVARDHLQWRSVMGASLHSMQRSVFTCPCAACHCSVCRLASCSAQPKQVGRRHEHALTRTPSAFWHKGRGGPLLHAGVAGRSSG